ncbi:hypothetical protein [Lentzea nigeriaca]|uniref:hypothetical protein n=1 Tax=Lentzea nigeriaca TaxID=1128665 RepID=UPI00195DF3A1|nr:hypothetical protein [Lentzea nigeriaca]MBM7860647.1 Asp-tRNA(Asn)/Glu-tRNA(Gln) amidotransferase A subunit family amidase [Lentzea nigeriaca]
MGCRWLQRTTAGLLMGIGGSGTDETLLRFAAAFEDAVQARRAPTYVPTMP